jgi:hypothetical protein
LKFSPTCGTPPTNENLATLQRCNVLTLLILLLPVLLAACRSPSRDSQANLVAVATVTPTVAPGPTATPPATCADIEAAWGKDWPALLVALERLIEAGQSCGPEPLLGKKYAAHYIYGVALEEQAQTDAAIAQYQAALFIDPQRQEALNALFRLKALPPPTPVDCLSTAPPLPDPAPAVTPEPQQFITVEGKQLRLAGQPFKIKGVNYYPRHAPWERFFGEADPAKMAQELDLIRQAGFNTLRVFLWYQPLFTCQPEDAIPREANFALLDTLIQLARERDLKLILVLNDLPDLTFRPLYTDYPHYDNQTIYLVRRYRAEPTILAWDLRNGGDEDYSGDGARFSQAEALAWLEHLSGLVRQHDPHHLLTAGWSEDPAPTEPYIDILSVQHWEAASELEARLKQFKETSDKPLLLESVGYHSWAESPDDPQDETRQAQNLQAAVGAAEAEADAGWLVWTAFDFVPTPGQPPTHNHFFGLWRVDLNPKPALELLPLKP